jgi:uncharacterized protein YeeX (DUF496 family)
MRFFFFTAAVFLLVDIPLQAQFSRTSDGRDVTVDVHIYDERRAFSEGTIIDNPECLQIQTRNKMASRYNRRQSLIGQDLSEMYGGYTPVEAGMQRAISELASQGRFGFDELEKKYPISQVRALARPEYLQRQIQKQELEDKYNQLRVSDYETQIQIRQAELSQQKRILQKTSDDVKAKAETQKEILQARKAVLTLDPNDSLFLKHFIQLQDTYPLAFEDEDFYTKVAEPLLSKHMMLEEHKLKLQRGEK